MLQANVTGDHRNRSSAFHHDEGLKDLLRIHLTEPDRVRLETEPANLTPALLGPYCELEDVRHDFPVVLVEDDADAPVVPLATIIDRFMEKAAPAGTEGERLRRHVYRLEALIKRLDGRKPGRRLSELWSQASSKMLSQSADREHLHASLDVAVRTLAHDGRLLSCDARTTRRIFEHVWEPLLLERSVREREVVDGLIARLSEVLESESARSPKSSSPEALESAFGGEHAGGIDFESLSSVLQGTRHGRTMPARRSKRLRVVRKVLESQRARLPERSGNGVRRRRQRRRASVCGSCVEALDRFDAELQRGVDLIRAARVAKLELENRYREARHDHYFETFSAAQLTPDEYRALSPLLVFLNAEGLGDAERSALVRILGSDMPVKIVLELHEVPGGDTGNAPPGTFTEWSRQIAGMAVAQGEAFVLQTAASHLPRLAAEVVEGLRYDGPALFCVYSAPSHPASAIPFYLRCAGAVESRAFPSFVYSPGRGADWASRFFLEGSPQRDRAWPVHEFVYEAPDGEDVTESLAFSCIDFLAMDPRFVRHFVVVPRERWHANMVPVDRFLALGPDESADKVPYVYLVDGEDRLHRVIVRRAILEFARKCQASWRRLQELAGINNSHVNRALEQARARFEEEHQPVVGPAEPSSPAQPAVPAAEPVPADAPAVAEAETAPESGQAYIDTDLCTSCDDCIQRNAAMFAYNDLKQAYIKDVHAGTYRDLVEAAENCPVCIIHPGKPQDLKEPDLAELQKRAAAFN